MAERPQNPGPMVRCAAGFDPDHRRRKRVEENDHLLAPQLLTKNHLLGGVHPMKLEKMFRRVHANSANLFHGRSPLTQNLLLEEHISKILTTFNARQDVEKYARAVPISEIIENDFNLNISR